MNVLTMLIPTVALKTRSAQTESENPTCATAATDTKETATCHVQVSVETSTIN